MSPPPPYPPPPTLRLLPLAFLSCIFSSLFICLFRPSAFVDLFVSLVAKLADDPGSRRGKDDQQVAIGAGPGDQRVDRRKEATCALPRLEAHAGPSGMSEYRYALDVSVGRIEKILAVR